MREKMRAACDRLTPDRDSRERMRDYILNNMEQEKVLSKKQSFSGLPTVVFACIILGILSVLVVGRMMQNTGNTFVTPVYACMISENTISLEKSPDTIEYSEPITLAENENSIFKSSDKGYTISLVKGSAKGQMIYLFFEVARDDNQKIEVHRREGFSSLDMEIHCKTAGDSKAEEDPMFEWFMLEDADPEDNKIQFGISLWNAAGAEGFTIQISDLKLRSLGQPVKGEWTLAVSLADGEKKAESEERLFLLNQEIDGPGMKMILRSVIYCPGTLTVVLEDPEGNLNKKPFVNHVITIKTDRGEIAPSYGSGKGDGTGRTLLYELNEDIGPEEIKALVIGEIEVLLHLEAKEQ